jgi:hypothetical protein
MAIFVFVLAPFVLTLGVMAVVIMLRMTVVIAVEAFSDILGSVARMAGDLIQRAKGCRPQITGDRP